MNSHKKVMIRDLKIALKEIEDKLMAERRLTIQLDLMLARNEIMKSIIHWQGLMIQTYESVSHKEAA